MRQSSGGLRLSVTPCLEGTGMCFLGSSRLPLPPRTSSHPRHLVMLGSQSDWRSDYQLQKMVGRIASRTGKSLEKAHKLGTNHVVVVLPVHLDTVGIIIIIYDWENARESKGSDAVTGATCVQNCRTRRRAESAECLAVDTSPSKFGWPLSSKNQKGLDI